MFTQATRIRIFMCETFPQITNMRMFTCKMRPQATRIRIFTFKSRTQATRTCIFTYKTVAITFQAHPRNFQAQAQKSLQNASRELCLSISRPTLKNRTRSILESYFQGFPAPGPKVAPEGFQGTIFKHFQAQAQKSLQKPSRKLFSKSSKPSPKSCARKLSGNYF